MKVLSQHRRLFGEISVPGSKSHTIRACLFAGLAQGQSRIMNPLPSGDCLSAVRVLREFGCTVELCGKDWIINGIGNSWNQPGFVIDVGNSGTLLYLLSGIVSTIPGYSILTGDKSICTRPIEDLLQAIRQLGAQAFTTRNSVDAPPVIIKGPIKPGTVKLKGTLSQYVSGLLIAGSLVEGKTRIELSNPKEIPFIMMTITWLNSMGVSVDYDKYYFKWLEVSGPNQFKPFEISIPSDWEGVAFPLVAAIITDSAIIIDNIDTSDTQGDRAIVDVLRDMGANIEIDIDNRRLLVKGGNRLHGIMYNLSNFPDALPILAVAASFAEGISRFTDIGVCRLKESDRISLMKKELMKFGVDVMEGEDYLEIHGFGGQGMHGAEVESYDDHRIAMALAVCGLAMEPGQIVVVKDAECCDVSFPKFFEVMNTIGAEFTIMES